MEFPSPASHPNEVDVGSDHRRHTLPNNFVSQKVAVTQHESREGTRGNGGWLN